MSVVKASIEIAAPPDAVWELVMDPSALSRWVTIHRRLLRADDGPVKRGFQMDQRIHMRGVNLDVHWELVECEPCRLAVWAGRGPAHSRARTEYRLAPADGGTRFDYKNDFRVPLGPLGALVSRALVGGMPDREAKRTLDQLRRSLERR